MPQVDLTTEEWQSVINMMAYAPGRDCIPFINKITAQVSHAAQERVQPGNGQLQHPRDDPGGPPSPSSDRRGAEHRAEKPAR